MDERNWLIADEAEARLVIASAYPRMMDHPWVEGEMTEAGLAPKMVWLNDTPLPAVQVFEVHAAGPKTALGRASVTIWFAPTSLGFWYPSVEQAEEAFEFEADRREKIASLHRARYHSQPEERPEPPPEPGLYL